MNPNKTYLNPKKILLFVSFVLIGILFAFWAMRNGRISISLASLSDSQAETNYLFTNSENGVIEKTSTSVFSGVVPAGNYQLFAKQNDSTFISTVSVKNFLRKSVVTGTLRPEAYRMIVGNNPSPCMFVVGEKFYSTDCINSLYRIVEHVPSSKNTPTYTNPLRSKELYGDVYGIVSDKPEVVSILLRDYEGEAGYSIQNLDQNLQKGQRRKIPLNKNKGYGLTLLNGKPYAYSRDLSEGYIVDTESEKLIQVFGGISGQGEPLSLVSHDGWSTLLFGDATYDTGDSEVSKSDLSRGSSTVILIKDGKKYTFRLNRAYSKASVCGNYVCLVGSTGLTVYERSGGHLLERYQVPGVTDIFSFADKLRFISTVGVMSFDTASRVGFIEYSFESYRYCGVGSVYGGYVVCVIDDNIGKIALAIDPSKPNNLRSIDKRIAMLAKNKDIGTVSANRNNIIVVPNYGSSVYDSKTKTFHPTKERVNKINQTLDDLVVQSGLQKAGYTVFVAKD